MDILDTIGFRVHEPYKRDAIHIAIIVVKAGENMDPATKVRITHHEDGIPVVVKDQDSVYYGLRHIGVIDPYLTGQVKKDNYYWMFLNPQSTTPIRHEWSHPKIERESTGNKDKSEKWLRDFAEELGVSYMDMVDHVIMWINGADGEIEYNTEHKTSLFYKNQFEFWKHFEVVFGYTKPTDLAGIPYRCSC